ncbi:variable large family protein, partial [Borreliella garinii]
QNKNDQIAAAIVLRGLAKSGKFANENAANGKVVAAVKSAVEWIKEMHKAVEDTAKAGGEGGNESIANVAAGAAGHAAGAKADVNSVTGIAKGMKAIVDAAGKAGVELKPAAGAGAGAGANAGKLFASGANGAGDANAAQGAAEAAGKAVSAVSGDQILKAIVDAAGAAEGKGAATAANAVEAAIGDDGGAAAFAGGMNKNDQIAAAIVLRGLAKSGKFANANNAANTKVVAAVKHMHRATEDTINAADFNTFYVLKIVIT